MNSLKGSGLTSDLLTLGFPIGLSIISNTESKDKEIKKEKKQLGGMLSDSFIIEAGLSIVPIGLLALNEISNKDNDTENK